MDNLEKPDGGWGWWIVFGSAVIAMVNLSLSSQFGLIFGQKMEDMGYKTLGIGFVMNMNTLLLNFSGLFTGSLLKNYSKRSVVVSGVFLSSIGMIMCSLSTNIYSLLVSYSLLTGVGRGIITPTLFVIINDYFNKRKKYAIGWSLLGTSVGQLLMPQLIQYLLNNFGYKTTVLILGAVCLNGLPAALLLHPVSWHMKLNRNESSEKDPLLSQTKFQNYYTYDKKNQEGKEKNSKWYKIIELFDLQLLLDFKLVHILIGISIANICNITFGMLIPFILIKEKGFETEGAAICMSFLSAADIIGRVSIPFITKTIKVRKVFLGGLVLVAASRSVFVEQTNKTIIIYMAMVCGLFRAALVLNQNLVIVEHLKDERFVPSAIGLSMLFKGVFVLLFGELFGWIRDFFESYRFCIHVQSSLLLIVAFSWFIEVLLD